MRPLEQGRHLRPPSSSARRPQRALPRGRPTAGWAPVRVPALQDVPEVAADQRRVVPHQGARACARR